MRISIPVEDNKMEADVCKSFGRAPYFLIYDTDNKESIFLANSATKTVSGTGIKAAQIIVDNEASALLTPRCGEKAADVLKAAGVKLYKTINSSAKVNLDDFINGELSPLTEIHAGLHGHGGN